MIRKIKFCLISFIIFFTINISVRAEPRGDQIITYSNFRYVRHIAASLNYVYFVTSRGIIVFNKIENRWEEPLTGADNIDHTDIHKIWVDKFDEKLFIETGSFIYEYDFFLEKWFPQTEIDNFELDYKHIRLDELMHPPDGYIYSARETLVDSYGRKFYINDAIDDNSGEIWIAGWGLGPIRGSGISGYMELMPFGLLQNNVNTIYNDSGNLWIGGLLTDTYPEGITIFDPDELSFKQIEFSTDNFFPYNNINSIIRHNNYMAIGSSDGVFFYDLDEDMISHQYNSSEGLFNLEVLSLFSLGDSLFVGTKEGLSLLTGKGHSGQLVIPSQFLMLSIYDFEKIDDYLWIATSGGVYRLHLKTGNLQQFHDKESFIFNDIYQIERYKSNLFFAADNGILQLNLETAETKIIYTYSSKLISRSLAVNDEIVVTGADQGMTIVFYNENPVVSRTFTTNDGLPSDYIFRLDLDGDFIWIGTDAGLSKFWWSDPDRIY